MTALTSGPGLVLLLPPVLVLDLALVLALVTLLVPVVGTVGLTSGRSLLIWMNDTNLLLPTTVGLDQLGGLRGRWWRAAKAIEND